MEFARVQRTLVEKALYDLEDEVGAAGALGSRRQQLFDQIQNKLRAGLSINLERQRAVAPTAGGQ